MAHSTAIASEHAACSPDEQGQVESFKRFINVLNGDRVDLLGEVFADEIVFTDPFHEVRGLENLKAYYTSMYENLEAIHFEFESDIVGEAAVAVPWRMFYRHRKIAGGKALELDGLSTLVFSHGKVLEQRDYFDAGALLYEHLPAIGWAVRQIKQRV